MLQKDKMSSNKLVSCIWRQVDTGNQWKVGYEGDMAESVGSLWFSCICRARNVTERLNKFKQTCFVCLEVG